MTAMPEVERMTAEEFLARPCHPRERAAELIEYDVAANEFPLLPGFALALDALVGE